jgi:DNA repair protein RecN (Recombination protein N)
MVQALAKRYWLSSEDTNQRLACKRSNAKAPKPANATMLRSLYVRDYAIIEELDVEFGSGLNVITGETGAGKSILIGALKMILGERADTDAVRTGAKKAIVEGIFDEAGIAPIREALEENEIEAREDVIMRREISASRSRAFINDTPATLDVVRRVAAELIDLHGQHEHQSLLRTEKHRELLDNFGSLGGLAQTYRDRYREVEELIAERNNLQRRREDLEERRQLYEFQIEEIDAVNPQEDEEDELEAEERVLENAEQLYESTARLYDTLYESTDAVHDQIVVARNELQDLARIDDDFAESLDEIQSAQIIVSEVAKFLQDYNARVEFDPERLSTIRERLSELERLKRKYGGTLESVLEHRREIGEEYALASDFDGSIEELSDKISEAQARLSDAAERLSEKRREVAARIEDAIEDELASLGMPRSRFEVRFERELREDGWIALSDGGNADEDGQARQRYEAFAHGVDRVEFFITTNVGEPPEPLKRIASGGEISRIMLALKTILAKSERLPILVFDEIDTGISGATAGKVGAAMSDLAQYHQIIAITHLPQIAALGDGHFAVTKKVAEGRTKTLMQRLSGEERAEEVATLISGADLTDAALENARELMAAGGDGAGEQENGGTGKRANG